MILDWSIVPPSGLVRWTPIEQGLPKAHELWASTHASESAWLTISQVSFHSTGGSICRDQIGAGRWPPMWDSQSLTSVGFQLNPIYSYLWKLIGCGVSTATPPDSLTDDTHSSRQVIGLPLRWWAGGPVGNSFGRASTEGVTRLPAPADRAVNGGGSTSVRTP